jgi:pseudouridine-5'-monophosphatase
VNTASAAATAQQKLRKSTNQLLINSEDLYTICTNAVLAEFSKPNLPWSVKARLQGRPFPEASRVLQEWAQLPITMDEFGERVREHQERLFRTTQMLPGVAELLGRLKADDDVVMAVATSSARRTYELKTNHLTEMVGMFEQKHIVVGDDPRIPRGRGKPAPDIYELALAVLNADRPADRQIHPEECLVFEDSVPGAEAGIRAGMQVVWVPHEGLLDVYDDRKEYVLAGLTGEHDEDASEEGRRADEEWEKKREEWLANGRKFARVRGRPGEVADGWGQLHSSLENFPLEWYGIGS